MSENESDKFAEDDLSLSSHALSALNEFFLEQQEQQQRFEQLKQSSSIQIYSDTEQDKANGVHMDFFKEDWQLSQFWYSKETTDIIIQEVLMHTSEEDRVACISTPTVFVKLKSITPALKRSIYLFEFDTRFDIYGSDFFRYDYKTPTEFRDCSKLRNTFDFIVVDPPFLSEDCFTKTMITVRWLGKKDTCKILLCTGAVMQDLADRLVKARMTSFYPQHQGGLANEFRCYINYQSQNIKLD
ncbi:10877_t:CDS:2 [Cetraspora pellucida]|uniref:Protein-lysine N-methyltransferase EFM5 n=1 Tax=Cetraspora pellucida TaxID=1433469 RepID=A0A9N8ZQS6_9GLOM|nr:10877_t:CDS:2 [Cetraspora pellucida]